jgi:hypothetical protein
VTPRYVLMLVGQLPDTSAFAASVRGGPEFRSWTFTNSLLVAIANSDLRREPAAGWQEVHQDAGGAAEEEGTEAGLADRRRPGAAQRTLI